MPYLNEGARQEDRGQKGAQNTPVKMPAPVRIPPPGATKSK